jgi:hypothetical protein
MKHNNNNNNNNVVRERYCTNRTAMKGIGEECIHSFQQVHQLFARARIGVRRMDGVPGRQ